MDAGAGSGAMGRFALLQGESAGGRQAYEDALRLTGLPIEIKVVDISLPKYIPMRYNLDDNRIEVNSSRKSERALAAQEMAEELFHATDHLGNGYTLSAASPLFDMKNGLLMLELTQHYNHQGYFKEFFDYPLDSFYYGFKPDRIKAEVFARLGVLYFAHPEVLKRELPQAYEVYHELFGLSATDPLNTGYVRSKIWTTSRGASQDGMQSQTKQKYGTDHAASSGKESASELGRLRRTISDVLKSPITGQKAKL